MAYFSITLYVLFIYRVGWLQNKGEVAGIIQLLCVIQFL